MSFVRCSNCRQLWRPDVNQLSDAPDWVPPVKKRGGCRHDVAIEVWTGTAWDVRPLVTS